MYTIIRLKCPESGGTVPLLYTMSRRPGRRLFIPLCAHPRARMRIAGKWVKFYRHHVRVHHTGSSVSDLPTDTMAKHSDPRRSEDTPGPSKRPKWECKYQIEWRSHRVYPSRKGPTFAFCESCGVDINVVHGGLNDVRKHLATSKHQEMLKATSGTSSLKALFRPSPRIM